MNKNIEQTEYSYSHDYILVTAFTQEIGHLTINKKNDNITPIVEEYLRDRVKEIKDRWK